MPCGRRHAAGIAARFAVRGLAGLYAANRPVIGPDPNVIHAGTVLVLPGRAPPARYTVAAGDTLAGIAAALAVRGGWPAVYAANRRVIGSDPNTDPPRDRADGPAPGVTGAARAGPRRRLYPVPPPPSAGSGHRPPPAGTGATAASGMPRWLKTMLLAVGLVVGAAFLAEPVLLVRRRRRGPPPGLRPCRSRPGSQCSCRRRATAGGRIRGARRGGGRHRRGRL